MATDVQSIYTYIYCETQQASYKFGKCCVLALNRNSLKLAVII